MSSKKATNKTVDSWTMHVGEIFIKHGLTPKRGSKTGSCIMPAPKHLKSVKQQQDTIFKQTSDLPQETME